MPVGGGSRAVEQPALALLVALGAGRGERVQHARRAVRQAEPAAVGELGDVAGEEPVVALRGGGGEDRLDHRVAAVRPVAGLHGAETSRRGRRAGPDVRRVPAARAACPAAPPARRSPRPPRPGTLAVRRELLRDHLRQMGRLGPVHHEQRGHRAGTAPAADRPARSGRRRRPGGRPGRRSPGGRRPGGRSPRPAPPPRSRAGTTDSSSGRDHDVEDVQVVEDDAARVHRRDRLLDRAVDRAAPRPCTSATASGSGSGPISGCRRRRTS